jgi:glycosyltransferase involved in cell wall biosynthesis
MKLLILTYHYPPDLSAGAYRSAALVDALLRADHPGLAIDVLTTCPNRYASYRDLPVGAGTTVDPDRPVTVTRLPVGRHRNGLMDQSLAFSGFAARALRSVRGKRYDIVVATSSRLFTGFLGAVIAGRTGARLYLDIRDLFVENMRDMYRVRRGIALLMPLLSFVERQTLRRAMHVNLVSEGFLDYFRQRFPQRQYSLHSNGIDQEFLEFDFGRPPMDGARTILYAGNIGLGQGIETIVPEAAHRLGASYRFRVIGDGGTRALLEQRLAAAQVRNVELIPPMDRESLKQQYREADFLLLHLNGFRALEAVLPSKLFEYAATGKPILAGVRGYARRFIAERVASAAVFDPGDADGMIQALDTLIPGPIDRTPFVSEYARTQIMDRMAAEILDVSTPGARINVEQG